MQTMDHKLVQAPELEKPFRILLAFSGLKQALTTNPGYNLRVAECQEAAKVLLTYVQIYLIHGLSAYSPALYSNFSGNAVKYIALLLVILFSLHHNLLLVFFFFSASGNSELESTLCNGKNTLTLAYMSLIHCMLIIISLLPSLYCHTEQLSMRSMKLTR